MHLVLRSIATVLIFMHLLVCWVVTWTLQELVKFAGGKVLGWSKTRVCDACGWLFRGTNIWVMTVANPLWRIKILRPLPHFPSDKKFIVVLNHLSNADPWLSIKLFWPTGRDWKYICKGSLFNVPFGGWGLKNNGDLAVRFTKEKNGWGTEKGSVRVLMDDAKRTIEHGNPIAVFPEGVRNPNPDGPVGQFKVGFFELAAQNGYSILPIAISGADDMWPVGDWQFDAATAYMSCGAFIEPQGRTAEELMQSAWDEITRLRESHPDRIELMKEKKE